MSEKVYEQLKVIRAKMTAFYNETKDDPNWTPRIAVVKLTSTSKYPTGTVEFIDVSKEYILGLTKDVKQ